MIQPGRATRPTIRVYLFIPTTPTLRRLRLSDFPFSCVSFPHLDDSTARRVHTLCLSHNHLTANGVDLRALCALPSLRILDLSHNRLTHLMRGHNHGQVSLPPTLEVRDGATLNPIPLCENLVLYVRVCKILVLLHRKVLYYLFVYVRTQLLDFAIRSKYFFPSYV